MRQELGLSPEELKHYVAQKTLRPVKASKDKMLFEGSAVLSLRRAWLDVGRDVLSVTKHRPRTEEEFQQAIEEVRQHRLSAPKAVKSRERIEELQRALEQQDREIKR